MCNINPVDLLSPKNHLEFNLEASGFKPGRFNPIPGPLGHGTPFGQFSGTYKGNDLMNKTGIAPSAQSSDYTPYGPTQSQLTAAAQAKLAALGPYATPQSAQNAQQAQAASGSARTDPGVAQFFSNNNVKVAK